MNIYAIKKAPQIKIQETYRNHRIVSYNENGKHIGEVLKNDIRIAYCESTGVTTLLQQLRTIIDDLIKQKNYIRKNAVPTQKQLINALEAVLPVLTDSQHAMLFYQVIHDNIGIDLEKLKSVAGCQNTTDIYLMLADVGRILCDEVAYVPPTPIEGRDPFVAMVLEPDSKYANTESSIILKFQADFFSALKSIKWR
tara:strand:+ start:4477 stop:5064 length:588 start_codon:yes stop_codon:yes gene_type:complete